MLCVQCEDTMRSPTRGDGCQFAKGMCGKTAETSDLQDLLIYVLQGLSEVAVAARKYGIINKEVDAFVPKALFSTLTNVNFDPEHIEKYAEEAIELRAELIDQMPANEEIIVRSDIAAFSEAATIKLHKDREGKLDQAKLGYIHKNIEKLGEDIIGLRLFCLYGLKGAAAYMEHAYVLGEYEKDVAAKFHELMAFLNQETSDIDFVFEKAMEIGQLNYRIMEMLDRGERTNYGDRRPTQVNTSPVKGKCILVSGHDLKDLEHILEQTKDKGINVYTHGEMLPAHSYPELKKYKHLVGNYGGAWHAQQSEFAKFPGAIVMTSNCIKDPNVGMYSDRIFTRNIVAWPGVEHLYDHDYSKVIEKALELQGFVSTEPENLITVGFSHEAVSKVSPLLIDTIKAGKIKHIYLIGGCDGGKEERQYYTDLAMALPKDNLILTLGCAKYRFNKLEFGQINGIPRLLDMGQCNDAYSAIQVALSLSEAFGCSVNELPLTLSLSWLEQKAIVIMLTLLSLNIKNIMSGPTKPGFMTENMAKMLEDKFGLITPRPVEELMKEIA